MEDIVNSFTGELFGYFDNLLFNLEYYLRRKITKYINKYKYYISKQAYTQEYDAIVSSTPLPYELCNIICEYSYDIVDDFIKRMCVALINKISNHKIYFKISLFLLEHSVNTLEKFNNFVNLLNNADLLPIQKQLKCPLIFLYCYVPFVEDENTYLVKNLIFFSLYKPRNLPDEEKREAEEVLSTNLEI